MSVTLEQLLEGYEGANDAIKYINSKASELKAKVLIDDGKDDIYVPKSRLDDEIGKKKTIQKQYDTAAAEIGNLKKDLEDKPDLLKKVQDLETDKTNFETKLKDLNLNSAIKVAAITSNPKDKTGADILAFINKENLKLNDDGTITGLDDEIKRLKTSKSYLFNEEPGGTGNPGNPGNPDKGGKNPQGGSIGENLAKETFSGYKDVTEARASFFK